MRLINNDKYVVPLKCPNLAIVNNTFKHLQKLSNNAYQDDVYLFETIHGHIVTFTKKSGRFIPYHRNTPERLNGNDLQFYADLGNKTRWFEIGHSETSIGLKRN